MKIKFYKILFAVPVIGSTLLSCGDDDDKKTQSVVGSWKEISTETLDCPNASDNRVDECAPTSTCETWQFKEDGTFTRTTSTNAVAEGTYFMMGDQIRLCYTGCLDYYFSISGSVLTITEIATAEECVTEYKISKI